MAAEAAVTGKPVHVLAMDRLRPGGKFDLFHRALSDKGITRPFTGDLPPWSYSPLDETTRAARKVLEVFNTRFPDRAVQQKS
jgi:mitochondrial fission protein ELM1